MRRLLILTCFAAVALGVIPSAASASGPPARGSALDAPDGFLGVSGRKLNRRDLPLMAGSGADVYRTLFHFHLAKRGDGGFYYWGELDRVVRLTAGHGLDLLPLLYGTPTWIHKGGSTPPIYDDRAIAEWQKLLRALVGRYGPDGLFWRLNPLVPEHPIRAWQIWNEPNLNKYWEPEPSPGGYAKLLKLSADALHDVDPSATIVSAGIVARPDGGGVRGASFLDDLAASRIVREEVDAFGYHPYARGTGGVKRHLFKARRILDKNGAEQTPIWVSEVGWGAEPKVSNLLQKPNEEAQARALRLTFKMMLRNREALGLEKALWYYWRDHADPTCLWCRSAGLMGNAFQPKPALQSFRQIAGTATSAGR